MGQVIQACTPALLHGMGDALHCPLNGCGLFDSCPLTVHHTFYIFLLPGQALNRDVCHKLVCVILVVLFARCFVLCVI